MKLLDTLFYYDGPLLITAVHEDQLYIGGGINPVSEDRFLLVAIDRVSYNKFLTGDTCLRTLMTKENSSWYLGSLENNEEITLLTERSQEPIPEEFLPEYGYYNP